MLCCLAATRRSPTRASLGTASLSISSLLVFSSGAKLESPVTLPPGRARLATKPAPTGSPAFVITMGMAVVAFLAANADGVPEATIRSTLRRTKSAVSSGRRSSFSLRKSILDDNVFSFNPAKLAQLLPERLQEDRDTGSSAMHPGNRCGGFSLSAAPDAEEQSAKSIAHGSKANRRFYHDIDHRLRTTDIGPSFRKDRTLLFYDLIRSCQHIRRNRQTNLFRCLQS